ncbi:MAG: hypothetical protein HGB32_13735 [Geobacteraceae bacterium]|nr:hypothetical protein [Geobacteraceae bacterium]NTW81187.1 hypothetical protein [Geobacteraceae bacterium]
MTDEIHELDEITLMLIADNLVCPFIEDCSFYHLYNRPDQNSLYYATHFCGNQFFKCQECKTRLGSQKKQAEPSDLTGPEGRITDCA